MIKSGVNYSISLNRAQVVHLHRIPHLNGRLFYGFVLLTKESLLKARPSVLFLVNVMFKLPDAGFQGFFPFDVDVLLAFKIILSRLDM